MMSQFFIRQQEESYLEHFCPFESFLSKKGFWELKYFLSN